MTTGAQRRRAAPPPKTPGVHRLAFEAALASTGHFFSMNAEGEARFTVVVSEAAAKPLAEAVAAGWLKNTSFIVQITAPDTSGQ